MSGHRGNKIVGADLVVRGGRDFRHHFECWLLVALLNPEQALARRSNRLSQFRQRKIVPCSIQCEGMC